LKVYKIIFAQIVAKELKKLPPKKRIELLKATKVLEQFPFPRGNSIKKLKGVKPSVYRLRVGDFRIIYLIGESTTEVISVISRKDLERRLKNLF
jgi:mRNA-degrading endonuclease RelE of RelBE toxin-antitoxin system